MQEETAELPEYYTKLLNVYAVHSPEYQLFTIKPGKLEVGGIEVVWRVFMQFSSCTVGHLNGCRS